MRKTSKINLISIVCFLSAAFTAISAKDRIQIDNFEYRGPQAEKWISDGFRDTVTAQLGRISAIEAITTEDQQRALRLITDRIKSGEDLDVQREIARVLQADFICKGSLTNGTEIQINMQLLKEPDFRVYRTATITVNKNEIPRGWEVAVIRLLGEINADVPDDERRHIQIPPTEKREAYEAYSQGLALMNTYPAQALTYFLRALVLDPNYADALLRAGQVNERLGSYDEAIRQLSRRLQILDNARQRNTTAYGDTLANIGSVYDSRGNFRQAVDFYKQAAAILESMGRTETASYATTLNNIAVAYRSAGELNLAMSNYQKSMSIREKIDGQKSAGYAASLQGVGAVYFTRGNIDQALEYTTRAARLMKDELNLGETSLYASTLHSVASILAAQQKFDEALQFFNRANDIRQKLGMQNSDEYSTTLAGISRVYFSRSDYNQALLILNQAKAIKDRLNLQQTPGYASVLSGIGGVYFRQDRVQEALAQFEAAGAIYRKLGLEDVLENADILSAVAIIYYEKLKNPCRARQEMTRVVAIYRKLERPDIGPRQQFLDRITNECKQ